MQLLNNQLKRNAGATASQIKQNDKFIDTLSNQVGIVDDDLRPAMGQLVRATGSVSQSQKLLRLALDASSATGKPLNTVTRALSNAFVGNKTQLVRLFPALKTSKDLFADLEKQVGGTAEQQADPFSKFNVAMDNLKEKLGTVILPYLVDFIDTMMKPGGAIDQVGKFLDDVSNPKTEAGKTFLQIKDAIDKTITGVKDFFAMFGDGDAMKGFGNVVSSLVKALPALLALKGILVLAKAGTSIANLAKAIKLMVGANAAGDATGLIGGKGNKGKGKFPLLGAGALLGLGMTLSLSGDTEVMTPEERQARLADIKRRRKLIPKKPVLATSSDLLGSLKSNTVNSVVINVQSADPKAVVSAVNNYVKQNGGLPGAWSLTKKGK